MPIPTTHSSPQSAYRSDKEFSAPAGYIAPNICAATGIIIQDDVKPTKVYLTTGDGWEKRLLYKIIFYILTTAALIIAAFLIDNRIFTFLTIPLWFLTLTLANNYKSPFIQIHYSKPYQTKRSRRNTLSTIFYIAAASIMILSTQPKFNFQTYILYLPLVIIGSYLYKKHPVAYENEENGHHYFKGAHENFLQALPTASNIK
ncbi:MAG: hypothetical protein ACSHX6_11415 [Akkermansiaceae bacterium]